MTTALQDLKKDYTSYVDSCLAQKKAVMPYNSWVQAKISQHEEWLEKLQRRMDECEGD